MPKLFTYQISQHEASRSIVLQMVIDRLLSLERLTILYDLNYLRPGIMFISILISVKLFLKNAVLGMRRI